MARLPHVIVPGHPHPVAQKEFRRETVQVCDADSRTCLDSPKTAPTKSGAGAGPGFRRPAHFTLLSCLWTSMASRFAEAVAAAPQGAVPVTTGQAWHA